MSAWHHDGEDFWDVMDAAAAQREAEESISRWRPVDADGDGWPVEYVDRVAWGILVQDAHFRGEGAACEQCGEHMAAVPEGPHLDSTGAECTGEVVPAGEYELRDAPDLAERIAEVLSTRPAVWDHVQRLMAATERAKRHAGPVRLGTAPSLDNGVHWQVGDSYYVTLRVDPATWVYEADKFGIIVGDLGGCQDVVAGPVDHEDALRRVLARTQ